MCPSKWREVYFGGNTVNKIKLQQSQIHKYIRSKFVSPPIQTALSVLFSVLRAPLLNTSFVHRGIGRL